MYTTAGLDGKKQFIAAVLTLCLLALPYWNFFFVKEKFELMKIGRPRT
jgi:hypothetical protein